MKREGGSDLRFRKPKGALSKKRLGKHCVLCCYFTISPYATYYSDTYFRNNLSFEIYTIILWYTFKYVWCVGTRTHSVCRLASHRLIFLARYARACRSKNTCTRRVCVSWIRTCTVRNTITYRDAGDVRHIRIRYVVIMT